MRLKSAGHHAEVAKDFRCFTTDCVFCNVIGGWKFLRRKQSMLIKPERSVKRHQTLSSQVGSGHETRSGERGEEGVGRKARKEW